MFVKTLFWPNNYFSQNKPDKTYFSVSVSPSNANVSLSVVPPTPLLPVALLPQTDSILQKNTEPPHKKKRNTEQRNTETEIAIWFWGSFTILFDFRVVAYFLSKSNSPPPINTAADKKNSSTDGFPFFLWLKGKLDLLYVFKFYNFSWLWF